MRILVTGAAGFIGAHAVRALLNRDHEVLAVVRRSSVRARLNAVAEGNDRRLTIMALDLDDAEAVKQAFAAGKPEACLHLAWYAEPGSYLEAEENLQCLRTGMQMVEALAAAECRRTIMVGSCAEYDSEPGLLREEGPLKPRSLYAASKLALSLVASPRARQLGMSFAWARLFYQYGPFEDSRRLIPSLILSLLDGRPFKASGGQQVRDYLHVADVASALVALLESPAEGSFNVCSSEPITIRHLLGLAGRLVGREELIRFGEAPPRPWDPPFICGDNRRLRTTTGWSPVHPLEDGLRSTVQWWKARTAGDRAA